jgi:F-type H+-transporting ATPase subunit b
MAEILRSLGQLFVQAIPTVIFVFFLLVILERWFFRPLLAILKQREDATVGALERAREQAAETEAKAREYEARFQAARQEVYRLREADRRAALAERESALARTREEAELRLARAEADLANQVKMAKQELERASQALARMIADTVLGNGLEPGGQKGAQF